MKTQPDSGASRTTDPNANPDAITGAPGSHPAATGTGAAGVGLAGAAIGTLAGPVGTIAGGIAGAVVGAVAGGILGKSVGEVLNPTEEAAFWQENHAGQPYSTSTRYEDYADAYRSGYEGHSKYASKHQSFDDAEPFIREDYARFKSPLEWQKARPAVSAAWKRRADAAEHHAAYPGIGV
jgi:hypothetical protein